MLVGKHGFLFFWKLGEMLEMGRRESGAVFYRALADVALRLHARRARAK